MAGDIPSHVPVYWISAGFNVALAIWKTHFWNQHGIGNEGWVRIRCMGLCSASSVRLQFRGR